MTGREPDNWAAGNGSRGGRARVFNCFQVVPCSGFIRCGQCRWLHSSLRVSPAVAGGHGAGPRQRAVRRGQSDGRPAAWGGGQNSLRPRAWRGAECLAASRPGRWPGRAGQQVNWRHLSGGIEGREVAGKLPGDREPDRRLVRVAFQARGPLQGEPGGERRRPRCREVAHQTGQEPAVALEGEAEGPAQPEVVIDTLVKVAHRAPPVHERTTWRKAAWSTLTGRERFTNHAKYLSLRQREMRPAVLVDGFCRCVVRNKRSSDATKLDATSSRLVQPAPVTAL